jgi:hypothetical protein
VSILHITAVFISRRLGPVIPTLAILKKGVPSRLYIDIFVPPVWDILLALAKTHRYKESQFYVAFKR